MLDCLPPIEIPCSPLFPLKFFTALSAEWKRRENAAVDEEKVQGEAVQERLQRRNLAMKVELRMSVCQSVLQKMSSNARVAVVSDILLQHMKACSTTLRSVFDTKIREVWVRDVCRACMYLSMAQKNPVVQRVQETIHTATKQTFCVTLRRWVLARRYWKVMNRTLVYDIASQTCRAYVPHTDSQMHGHCTPLVHPKTNGNEGDRNHAYNGARTSARRQRNVILRNQRTMQWRQVGENDEVVAFSDISSLRVKITEVLRELPPLEAALHVFVRDGVATARICQIIHRVSGWIRQADLINKIESAEIGKVGVWRCVSRHSK